MLTVTYSIAPATWKLVTRLPWLQVQTSVGRRGSARSRILTPDSPPNKRFCPNSSIARTWTHEGASRAGLPGFVTSISLSRPSTVMT